MKSEVKKKRPSLSCQPVSVKSVMYALLGLCLSACSLTPSSKQESRPVYQAFCLGSEAEARRLGNDIYRNGYSSRVSYWVYGDSSIEISSLALLWEGFDRHNFCDPSTYPIVIRFKKEQTGIATDQVYKWSKIVLENMLRERGVRI
ncbi:hypothetical protein HMF8227_01246 [Saliniradius amylolyticus]|uniref:Uncharacterized protein n=1 Tax=Saliniradius amylolyticus TaxID=2183582 RepID=A0A2S2E3Z5_9ALTE|nr:hypothetical protein [Saliniradius amylolyticus]AWL11727.1 hypothetical protein HMF8227_01246 [Saliniradius amylolyticus]